MASNNNAQKSVPEAVAHTQPHPHHDHPKLLAKTRSTNQPIMMYTTNKPSSGNTSIPQLRQRLPTQPLHLPRIESRSPLPAHPLASCRLQLFALNDTTFHPRPHRRRNLGAKAESYTRHTRPLIHDPHISQVAANHAQKRSSVGGELVFLWRLRARGDYD